MLVTEDYMKLMNDTPPYVRTASSASHRNQVHNMNNQSLTVITYTYQTTDRQELVPAHEYRNLTYLNERSTVQVFTLERIRVKVAWYAMWHNSPCLLTAAFRSRESIQHNVSDIIGQTRIKTDDEAYQIVVVFSHQLIESCQ